MATLIAFPRENEDSQVEMKLGAEEKNWLSNEIAQQLKRKNEPPTGFWRFLLLLKEWGATGAAITASIALLALAASQFYAANSRLKEEGRFEGETDIRLKTIEGEMNALLAVQSPGKVLKKLAALSPSDLAYNLPAIREISEQTAESVKPSSEELKTVANHLSVVNENSADYWPAVMKFIQFASSSFAPDVPMKGAANEIHLVNAGITGRVMDINHKVIYLDGAELRDITIVGSRIIFTTKPTRLFNVQFVNCAFEFPPDVNPPPPFLRDASRSLLMAGIQSALIRQIS